MKTRIYAAPVVKGLAVESTKACLIYLILSRLLPLLIYTLSMYMLMSVTA